MLKALRNISLLWVFFGLLLGATACKQKAKTPQGNATGVVLVSLVLAAAQTTLGNPGQVQVTAEGAYSDGSKKDVTQSVTWISTAPYIAMVNNTSAKGLVSAKSHGQTLISANLEGVVGSLPVTVTPAELQAIQVEPINPSYAQPITPNTEFKAYAFFADGIKSDVTNFVTWSSASPAVATIEAMSVTPGKTTNLAAGSSVISATYGGVTGSSTLSLTAVNLNTAHYSGGVKAYPLESYRQTGDELQFTALAFLSDGTIQEVTDQVTWAVDNSFWAVSNQEGSKGRGVALANSSGTPSLITPKLGSSINNGAATYAKVTPQSQTLTRISIAPENPLLAAGIGLKLKAFAAFNQGGQVNLMEVTDQVSWESSDSSIVTVCNDVKCKGEVFPSLIPSNISRAVTVTARLNYLTSQGSTQLALRSHLEGLEEIQITPLETSSQIGSHLKLKAIGRFASPVGAFTQDLSDQVTWRSSDSSIAKVSNLPGQGGRLVQLKAGTTQISATYGGVTATRDWSVVPSSYSLTKVELFPPSPTWPKGYEGRLRALATWSDGTKLFKQEVTEEAVWTSGNTALFQVDNRSGHKGRIHGAATGSATVTASFAGVVGTTQLTLATYSLSSLEQSPVPNPFPIGAEQNLKAIARYTTTGSQLLLDVTDQVDWQPGGTAVTIQTGGKKAGALKGMQAGSLTLSASFTHDPLGTPSTVKSTQSLTVSDLALSYLNPHPNLPGHVLGEYQKWGVEAVYQSGSFLQNLDVTPQAVFWQEDAQGASLNPIYNEGDYRGWMALTQNQGGKVYAQVGSERAASYLKPNQATLVSLAMESSTLAVLSNTHYRLKLLATYSNDATVDVTEAAHWDSSAPTLIQVSSVRGEKGKLYPLVNKASATITAYFQGKTATAVATEMNPSSVAFSKTSLTLTQQGEGLLKLYATANGVQYELGEAVYWTSSNPTVVAVDNSPGQRGQLRALGIGSANITVTGPDNAALSLTAAVTVLSSDITKVEPSGTTGVIFSPGETASLAVKGFYSASGTEVSFEATQTAQWRSSNPSIVAVNNRLGSKGLITAMGQGAATIEAKLGAKSYYFSVYVK